RPPTGRPRAPAASAVPLAPGTQRVEGNPTDQAVFESIRSAAARRDARFVAVRLLCEEGELVRRLQSPERAGLLNGVDPADAINKSRHHAVLDPKLPATLTLEVTTRSAEDSAATILAHIKSAVLDD